MKQHANALTRKLGPLPAWAWAVLAGGIIYWYRNRQGSAGTYPASGYPTGINPDTGLPWNIDPTTGMPYGDGGGGTGSGGGGDPTGGGAGGGGGSTDPGGTPGSPGGRKHHRKPHKRRLHHRRKKRRHEQHRTGRHTDHGHGDDKARTHRTGAQHLHRARAKRIIPRRTRQVTHSGVHHDLHGASQARNEPHTRAGHLGAGNPKTTPTKHSARNSRGRVHGIRAALLSVSPIPRGAGRPRVGATLTAEGRNRGGELAHVTHPRGTAGGPSRNRIAAPPMQGHISRQARPAEAARPIVLRGGRNAEHESAARNQLHATQKKPGVAAAPHKRRPQRKRRH